MGHYSIYSSKAISGNNRDKGIVGVAIMVTKYLINTIKTLGGYQTAI